MDAIEKNNSQYLNMNSLKGICLLLNKILKNWLMFTYFSVLSYVAVI